MTKLKADSERERRIAKWPYEREHWPIAVVV